MTDDREQFPPNVSSGYQALRAGPERVFSVNTNVLAQMAGTWALGLALVAICVFLTVLAAHSSATPDNPFRPGTGAGFVAQLVSAIFGVFAILRGVFLLRTTRRVVLNADGAGIDNWISRRFVRWELVARIKCATWPLPYSDKKIRVIELLGTNHRRLAVISDTLQGFEALANELTTLPSALESSEAREDDKARLLSKERRRLRRIAFVFLFFALGNAGALVAGINEEWHTRQLARNGINAEATILRTWITRVTPWVKFSFRDATGRTFSREAMMYQGPEWERLKTAKTMTVIYLPSAPDWNRVDGEDPGAQFSGSFLFLSSGGLLMFSMFFVTTLRGYNLKIEDGVTYLTKHGEVIKQWRRK